LESAETVREVLLQKLREGREGVVSGLEGILCSKCRDSGEDCKEMLGQEYAAEEAGVDLQESGSLVSLNSSGLSESVLVGQEELRTGDVSLLRQVCSPQTLRNRPADPVLTSGPQELLDLQARLSVCEHREVLLMSVIKELDERQQVDGPSLQRRQEEQLADLTRLYCQAEADASRGYRHLADGFGQFLSALAAGESTRTQEASASFPFPASCLLPFSSPLFFSPPGFDADASVIAWRQLDSSFRGLVKTVVLMSSLPLR
jgi:hypothetical protein